jgi:hypothetical protein
LIDSNPNENEKYRKLKEQIEIAEEELAILRKNKSEQLFV